MKKSKIDKNVLKIKFSIICILFGLLALSFLFASEIEIGLGLRYELYENQLSSELLDDADFKVTYLDVGQGNSVFIEFPDGKTMLIDGGSTMYGETVYDYIISEGYTSIDYLVASHADSDHIGGLIYVLDNLEVKNIYRPFQIACETDVSGNVPIAEEDLAEIFELIESETNNRSKISVVKSETYKAFIQRIYSETYVEDGFVYSSEITVFYDGLIISGENYSIEFFAPEVRDGNYNLLDYSSTNGFATVGYGKSNSNDNSAIMLVEIYEYSFLFTGDASWTASGADETDTDYEELNFVNSLAEEEIERFKNVSVYLVGHHGSKYSSSEALLSLITPSFAVVSVGDNNYGHPDSTVLTRLDEYCSEVDYLLMTIDVGNIIFIESNGVFGYVLEVEQSSTNLTISWYLLGTILFIAISYVIIMIKPLKAQNNWLNSLNFIYFI